MSEVISKAGIHCIGGTRNGYGEFCQRIADAGRRLSVVKVRDDLGAVDEPLKHWPDVLCVGAFTEFDRLPFDFARFSARARLKPQIRIWEVLNEDDASHTYAAKTDLYISIAPQFKANGWALGLFSCASGTPPYPIEDNGVAYAEIARACKWMIDNEIEAYLCVHEYQSSGGTIGRFKVLADYLEQRGALLPIIVTEYGYETHPGDTQFMSMVRANDPIYMADRRVLGCALWTLGGGGWAGSNYQTALPALGEYIATVDPVNPPISDYIFKHWLNMDTNEVYSTDNPLTITMQQPLHLKAITQPKPPPEPQYVTLDLETDGYGTVTGAGQYMVGDVAVAEWLP